MRRRNKVVALFFALPNELQIHILRELTFGDILSLRLSNSSFYHLINQNESPIIRRCIKHDALSLSLDLWPPPQPPKPATIFYLRGLTHRSLIAWDLATHIADFIMIKICRRTTTSQQEGFNPQHVRIRSRAQPLILTLYHFFESYRNILLVPIMNEARVSSNSTPLYEPPQVSLGGAHSPCDFLNAEKRIIDGYDSKQLLQVHQMYKLLLAAFVRKLRPPSYAGRFERSLRGWSKTPASQDDIVKVLVLGGIREVKRIIEIKTYAARRKSLDEFIEGLKLPKDDREGGDRVTIVTEPPIAFSANSTLVANSVERFVTAFLNEEMIGRIAPLLPELRHIWSNTAEATLLDKGVIRSVHEIPTMREFIESLMRDEDSGGRNDELHDGVYEDTSDGEEERIGIEGLALS